MQCTKRDVFMTFVFDFGAFHLVKCRAIVKLTILSKYIKQRPTVKFERLSLPQSASSRLITSGSFTKSWKKVASSQHRDVTFHADQSPESWKDVGKASRKLMQFYFSLLLFKNNKVECLRAKHSLWAEIHLASSHFTLFVPSGTIESSNSIVCKQPFIFSRSLESGSPIYWLRSCRMMEFKWIFRLIVTRLTLYTSAAFNESWFGKM